MNVSILTLFPNLYESFLKTSLVFRAHEKNIINSDLKSLFDFCLPKERVDGPTFGPGPGMLIKPEVVEKAIEFQDNKHGKSFKIFFSPQGKKLTQPLLKSLLPKILQTNHLLLFASRYEGIDERVEQYYADEVISLGDFILMGGDLPAMCFLESFLRLLPSVIGKTESVEHESFSGPFFDYPAYTEPVNWKCMEVPEVIRSGNHGLIEKFREEAAVKKTVKNNFEWIKNYPLTHDQKKIITKFIPGHYSVLMHGDILLKDKTVGTTSVTSLDIHDVARSSLTYGFKNYFIATPLFDQQQIVNTLIDFWKSDYGKDYNSHRFQAINSVILVNNLDEVVEEIEKKEGKKPILIVTSAKKHDSKKYITYFDQEKVWAEERPVLIIFGTGHGLAPHIIEKCDFILGPIGGFSDFNHLSVRAASSIVFDRWLGINPKY